MSDREDSRRTALRAVIAGRDADDEDATAGLRHALGTLDGKLTTAGGLSQVADWLRRTERLLADVPDAQLEQTRKEIRELIERLLELNAQVQTVVRLKRLFS